MVSRMNRTSLFEQKTERLAREWVSAWNSRNLDRIIAHYHDDVRISSPFIRSIAGGNDGVVAGKAALREYWATALGVFNDLHFELFHVYPGVRSMVIHYRSVAGYVGAEYMRLAEDGLIDEVHAHYAPEINVRWPDRPPTQNRSTGI